MAKSKKKKDKKAAKKEKRKEKKVKEAPKKEEKKPAKKARPIPKDEEGLRGIIRIAGKDVLGHITLRRALLAVKGIGHTTRRSVADILARELKVEPTVKVGTFSDAQIEQIDGILMNIQEYGLPSYLLNRRKDSETGKDVHNIMNDLVFAERQDIEDHKKTYTWKGYRHAYGQRVRGQKTRNTGRKGMSLGVVRKAMQPATAGGKTSGSEKGKGGKK